MSPASGVRVPTSGGERGCGGLSLWKLLVATGKRRGNGATRSIDTGLHSPHVLPVTSYTAQHVPGMTDRHPVLNSPGPPFLPTRLTPWFQSLYSKSGILRATCTDRVVTTLLDIQCGGKISTMGRGLEVRHSILSRNSDRGNMSVFLIPCLQFVEQGLVCLLITTKNLRDN